MSQKIAKERPSQRLVALSLTKKELERILSWYDHSLHVDEVDDTLAARLAALEVQDV